MDKTVYVVCCALAYGLMVIGEAVAKAEAGCFLPNRICGVKIPDEKAGGGEFEVVECNGLRWYVDAKATSVTGSVFRTMTCTYDYRSGRTLSVLLRRVFDDDNAMVLPVNSHRVHRTDYPTAKIMIPKQDAI